MGYHSPNVIGKLETLLNERLADLVSAMKGSEVSKTELSALNQPDDYRYVSSADVRIAADDFGNILKEIKSSLGKK